MTKEKLYELFDGAELLPTNIVMSWLDSFFSQNVCIPKGENRHPYADVLHAYLEDTTLEIQGSYKESGFWKTISDFLKKEYRIKPSEPLYEYKVRMNFKDGSFEYTEKYFTKQEFDDFGFPSSCELAEATKQERKQ